MNRHLTGGKEEECFVGIDQIGRSAGRNEKGFNWPDWNQAVRQTPSLITSTETLAFSTLTEM